MILSGEALRLAAIEILRPTEATVSFPTLAGAMVFDSRAAAVTDLDGKPDGDLPYTPVLALYTRNASAAARGEAAAIDDNECMTTLEIVGELAVIASDDAGDYVDAMAANDPEARLVLAAMMAQVRRELLFSERGHLLRKVMIHCERIERETHAVPEYGLRFQREFMRMTFKVRDDEFSDAGGLTGPVKALFDALPAGSYAKAKLTELAGHLAAETRTPLAGIDFTEPDTGETFTADTTG